MSAPAPAPTRSGSALRLAAAALVAVVLLEGVRALTHARIEAARRAQEREALQLVLPAARFDNDPNEDRILLRAPRWLGTTDALPLRRASLHGQRSAWIVEAVAPDGYAGPIRLLVAVDSAHRVVGVRVTEHQETPGLGDPIDGRHGDWPRRFEGRALGDPPRERWKVRRDGGEFDQFAGATVSPRAVVAAVRRVLELLERHAGEIDATARGAQGTFDDGP